MSFLPLSSSVAVRYGFTSNAHRFAFFVAILSIIGIAIGVAALIIDTAIMQGLESRLKSSVLKNTPHVVAEATLNDADKLLGIEEVIALCPFVQGQVLMQGENYISLVNLEGMETSAIITKGNLSVDDLEVALIPERGSFALNAQTALYLKTGQRLMGRARLISTINARYTPLGLTPTQRIFTLKYNYSPPYNSAIPSAIGNYDDVRRLFRMPAQEKSIRLWLNDPFSIEPVRKKLDELGFKYTDWTDVQGEFFKAVALEKLSMAVMIFLVIVVAAFNILSALAMMVSARLSEIAVLKTLGFTNGRIMSVFMQMGIFSGLAGTLAGFALGIPLTYVIPDLIEHNANMGSIPAELSFSNLFMIASGSVLMTLLFTVYPAYKASVTDPAVNLSRG
ncbi:MAG: FtsX-like permease family protein [Succinivibrio sp.]